MVKTKEDHNNFCVKKAFVSFTKTHPDDDFFVFPVPPLVVWIYASWYFRCFLYTSMCL